MIVLNRILYPNVHPYIYCMLAVLLVQGSLTIFAIRNAFTFSVVAVKLTCWALCGATCDGNCDDMYAVQFLFVYLLVQEFSCYTVLTNHFGMAYTL